MITVAFFNNKGGVGKTSLVYHLAWTYSDMGLRVLVIDLDPQSNLSALCVSEDRLEELWSGNDESRESVYACILPVKEELGDIAQAHIEELSPRLGVVVGDVLLGSFEAKLSESWPKCLDRHGPSFRATTAFYRVAVQAAEDWHAEIVLMDVGPNLGALNRSALIAVDHVVVPLGADLFSIQALRNLGPTLRDWREQWSERCAKNPLPDLPMPEGAMKPAGYVVMQPNLYGGHVTRAYERWITRIPTEFARHVLNGHAPTTSVNTDPLSFGVVKHYRSLMPLAHDARKPIFHLQAADGVLGAHGTAAREAGKDFRRIGRKLADRVGLDLKRQD